jgi:hypothetical protein
MAFDIEMIKKVYDDNMTIVLMQHVRLLVTTYFDRKFYTITFGMVNHLKLCKRN